MIVYLYGLRAARGPIRYVGKASNLFRRYLEHQKRAHRGMNLPVYDWWRSLSTAPEIVALMVVDEAIWQDAERSLIASLRGAGYRLLNVATGGEGGDFMGLRGTHLSAEHRAKISLGLRQSDLRFRPHLSTLNRRINATRRSAWTDARRQQYRNRFSGTGNPFYGKKHSQATKEKISAARRTRPCK